MEEEKKKKKKKGGAQGAWEKDAGESRSTIGGRGGARWKLGGRVSSYESRVQYSYVQ